MAATPLCPALRRVVRTCGVLATVCLLVLLFATGTEGVDRNKFRTCKQTDFCRRLRRADDRTHMDYRLEASSVTFDAATATITLPLQSGAFPAQPALDAKITIHNDGVVRLTASESAGLHPRHPVQDVIQPEAVTPYSGSTIAWSTDAHRATAQWTMTGAGDSYASREGASASSQVAAPREHTNKLILQYAPFRLSFLVDNVIVMHVNSENLLHFEQYRTKNAHLTEPVAPVAPVGMEEFTAEQKAEAEALYQTQLNEYALQKAAYDESLAAGAMWPADTAGAWSESHGGHTDNKARGPAALGLDVTFVNTRHVYGIPEHASSFALKNTIQSSHSGAPAEYAEPYRLFNLDVFEYELNEPMALYGAVPYVTAHSQDGQQTSGMLWLNAAETYVDISSASAEGGLFSAGTPTKTVHWMSETGRLDAFFILGPQPSDVFRQYTQLTGKPFMPPQFAIGYHQCRWNYKSSEDVLAVDAGFDEHDIPYDVLWLDIEHTDGKRYFTWDKTAFPQPRAMQQALSDKGRRMVNIVDPHIKRDANYHVHAKATELGHYIKKSDGTTDYDGWCWPGSSSYLDFFQQKVRDFWAENFAYTAYDGSTPSLFIWNDMNEPSVFNGPEVTMPKDNLHRLDGIDGLVEHREVHNQYGAYVHAATYQGLKERDAGRQRPFVLTRAFFPGSQRTAAVWTGDNTARWDHLAVTQPMLLSLAVAQIPFAGSDVGGFFGDPDAQLLTRWYQAGAFHPFFRGHAHIDTKRREPWVMGEPYTSIIRAAIRTRYAYLPYLYTLFQRNTRDGMPILRPLWVEFPADAKTHGVDDQFLLGPSLLIHPVVQADQQTAVVYLPASGSKDVQEIWYDLQNDARFLGGDSVNVLTPLQHIPVFQRGGSIIAKRERPRRCSSLMKHDPYTLVVALSAHQTASGALYLDDTNTFEYERGAFLEVHFALRDGLLTGTIVSELTSAFEDRNTIERIVLLGENTFSQATLVSGTDAQGNAVKDVPLALQSLNGGKRLILRKPDVRIGSAFQIRLA